MRKKIRCPLCVRINDLEPREMFKHLQTHPKNSLAIELVLRLEQ